MWNKSFLEARKIDVRKYVKKRKGSDAEYLPWAACKLLLHENGAEKVDFNPVPGANGSILLMSDQVFGDSDDKNRCYEVCVKIQVDSDEWITNYPVLNGIHPVKDKTMNQLRVSNAVRRAFVKGVAQRLGLGFDLWMDEDDVQEDVYDLSKHNILKIRQRTEELITSKIKSGIPFTVLCDRLGKDEEEVRSMLGWYKILAKLEHDIWEIQK